MFDAMKRTARSGRLRTELMLHDREIRQRQEAFGVQLYDYLEPLSKNPSFFSSDDRLTQVLRPALLESQREIAVVYNKQVQLKEKFKQAEVKRAAAFPKKAENWQEKLSNAAKSTSLAGGEAKLKAEEIVLDNQLKAHKQQFGVKLYGVLEALEDNENWLPTDREVRSIYDACRRDIETTRKKAKEKMQELETLGVSKKELEKDRAHEAGESYAAPAPASMAPVHTEQAYGTSSSMQQQTPKDPYASTPTAALPVATHVNNPQQQQPQPQQQQFQQPATFASSETPVLAYASTAPAPTSAPPSLVGAPTAPPAGTGAMGGQPLGGERAVETHSMRNFNTSGFSNGTQSQTQSMVMGGTQQGGGGAMNFANFSDHSDSNHDDEFAMAMGGNPGMGTGGGMGMGGGFQQQQQPQQQQQNNNNPWGNQDPFAALAPAPAAPPPQQQQQQQQQHPDSNLFLY